MMPSSSTGPGESPIRQQESNGAEENPHGHSSSTFIQPPKPQRRKEVTGFSWHVSAKLKSSPRNQGASISLEKGCSKEAESSRNCTIGHWGNRPSTFSPVSSASSSSVQRSETLIFRSSGDPKMLTPGHASETSVNCDIFYCIQFISWYLAYILILYPSVKDITNVQQSPGNLRSFLHNQ